MIRTPDDGSTWLCDAAIETDEWLDAVLNPAGIPLHSAEWDNSPEVIQEIEAATGVSYVEAVRDNCYNSENDFADQFTFTVYVPEAEYERSGDWIYCDGAFVAVCLHLGGDVRGNYGAPTLYRSDPLCDSGFLDWVVGFTLETLDDGEWECPQDREADECGIGYHSHPGCHVESEYGDGEWRDGAWYPEAHPTKRFIPYTYAF